MTDKEKLNAIKAEVQNYIDAAHKAHTNITEGNFAHLLSFIDSLQEEPVNDDLEKVAEEWDESLYRSDAFKAGAKWLNNIICSEIEKRLQYMQYAPHRADTYKELKSLLAYIKSYV